MSEKDEAVLLRHYTSKTPISSLRREFPQLQPEHGPASATSASMQIILLGF
jgi:hypothetical protein